jgi:hypothetical protein
MKRTAVILAVLGILLFLSGLTFTLQGYGFLGPTNGFMYNNPTWVYSGLAILVFGVMLLLGAWYSSTRAAVTKPPSPQA